MEKEKPIKEEEFDFWRIENFSLYFEALHKHLEEYVVFVGAKDTPCGPGFSDYLGSVVQGGVNTRINLNGHYRMPYLAVIDHGELVHEEVGTDRTQPIIAEGTTRAGVPYSCFSGGYEAEGYNFIVIAVNGVNTTPGARGITVVVYDDRAKHLVDSVNFDTYETMECRRGGGFVPDLEDFVARHPRVKVASLVVPRPYFGEPDAYERFLLQHKEVALEYIPQHLEEMLEMGILSPNCLFAPLEVMKESYVVPNTYELPSGARYFHAYENSCFHTEYGIRRTCHQPEKYDHTVFLIGPSYTVGLLVDDERTVASYMQRALNELSGEKWRVCNYGFYIASKDPKTYRERRTRVLEQLPVKDGDIVISMGEAPLRDVPVLDLTLLFMRPHSFGEVFWDLGHYTPVGNEVIGKRLAAFLQTQASWPYPMDVLANRQELKERAELYSYQQKLARLKESISPRTGAIVMNCNPFTLGHRYLIEQAAKQVDRLVIFVVEEDKSVFPFADRLELVKKGVADLEKVSVVASGKHVLSAKTFSGYFSKEEAPGQKVDASMDVRLFGAEIAPCLDIKVRFVGEEPLDAVTRAYNETMKHLLPEYGIDVVEIPRKQQGNEPISASKVRKLLQQEEWAEIEKLVPMTTLDYLKKRAKGTWKA